MKKERLRKRVFSAAWQIVQEHGVEHLNVRKLAKMSDCSLGSIYNAFGSFQDLQLHLNAKILELLYEQLLGSLEKAVSQGQTLRSVFKNLGVAYIEYGKNNLYLWKCLFEHLPFENIPDWYRHIAQEGIFRLCDRIKDVYGLSKEDSRRIVGFFWASIHGLSEIFLNQKMKMVSELLEETSVDSYIEYCLDGLFRVLPDECMVSRRVVS